MLTLARVLGKACLKMASLREKLSQGPEALLSRGGGLTFSASDRFLRRNETQGGEENCPIPRACVCQRLLQVPPEKLCFELIGTACSGNISTWNRNLWSGPLGKMNLTNHAFPGLQR